MPSGSSRSGPAIRAQAPLAGRAAPVVHAEDQLEAEDPIDGVQLVADAEGDGGGHVATGRLAADEHAPAAELGLAVLEQPGGDRHAVVGPGRERVLGRQAVVDGHDGQAVVPGTARGCRRRSSPGCRRSSRRRGSGGRRPTPAPRARTPGTARRRSPAPRPRRRAPRTWPSPHGPTPPSPRSRRPGRCVPKAVSARTDSAAATVVRASSRRSSQSSVQSSTTVPLVRPAAPLLLGGENRPVHGDRHDRFVAASIGDGVARPDDGVRRRPSVPSAT